MLHKESLDTNLSSLLRIAIRKCLLTTTAKRLSEDWIPT